MSNYWVVCLSRFYSLQGLVKIKANDLPLKKAKIEKGGHDSRHHGAGSSGPGSVTGRANVKFNNSHLPAGCQDGNRWRRVFVPTYIGFVAGYRDPWTVNDKNAVAIMQAIWNKVYENPRIAYQIEPQQEVFSVVSWLPVLRLTVDLFATRLSNVFSSGAQHSARPPSL
jgi:hypothetical protein